MPFPDSHKDHDSHFPSLFERLYGKQCYRVKSIEISQTGLCLGEALWSRLWSGWHPRGQCLPRVENLLGRKEPAPCDKGSLPVSDPWWKGGGVHVYKCVMGG